MKNPASQPGFLLAELSFPRRNTKRGKLDYYEMHDIMEAAIAREKQVKGGSRKRKIALIETMNPDWKDLYETLA
jgi:predicted GIY-YIG superfamily endonuclease